MLLSLVVWLLVGEFVGWVFATLSLGLAGAGHGSIIPIVLALGSALFPALYINDEYYELSGAALYACYIGWVWVGWQLGLRRRFARMVLVFHLLSVSFATFGSRNVIDNSEPARIAKIWEYEPVWLVCFVALLIAFYGTLFAMSIRPQNSRLGAGPLADK